MPIHFSVYPVGRLVRYTVEGDPTAEEAGAFLDAVLAHPPLQARVRVPG